MDKNNNMWFKDQMRVNSHNIENNKPVLCVWKSSNISSVTDRPKNQVKYLYTEIGNFHKNNTAVNLEKQINQVFLKR